MHTIECQKLTNINVWVAKPDGQQQASPGGIPCLRPRQAPVDLSAWRAASWAGRRCLRSAAPGSGHALADRVASEGRGLYQHRSPEGNADRSTIPGRLA